MSCPLLDKLAPELRARIWEYTLAFDAPLQHVTNMEPFADKTTKSASKPPRPQDMKTSDASDQSEGESAFARVNTSVLTANKRIYLEAIETFYKQNTIVFDGSLFSVDTTDDDQLVAPLRRKSDLWLAAHVVFRINSSKILQPGAYLENIDEGFAVTFCMIRDGNLELWFPRLESATVFLNTDGAEDPVGEVFKWADLSRKRQECTVDFDSVGSTLMSVKRKPNIQLRVQWKALMQFWTEGIAAVAAAADDDEEVHEQYVACSLYSFFKDAPLGQNSKDFVMQQLADAVTQQFEHMDPEEFEFWTGITGTLHYDELLPIEDDSDDSDLEEGDSEDDDQEVDFYEDYNDSEDDDQAEDVDVDDYD